MAQEDLSQIINVVNLYAVAVDSRRYTLFERVFTPDVRIDFGGGAAWTGRDQLMSGFKAVHAVFSATQHIVSGHTSIIEGDTALCLSYVHARFLRDIPDGLFDSTGWYDDQLVRTADGWRIKDRVSRMVSATGNHRVMQAMPDVDTNFNLLSLDGEAEAGRIRFLKP